MLQYILQSVRGMSGHDWLVLWLKVTVSCSALHNFLPPWDWKPKFITEGLCDFPNAQATFCKIFHNRWYKLLIYVVGYIALNGRTTVWGQSIGIKKQLNQAKEETGQQISDAAERQ
jgi:hypothetical protein